GLGGGQGRGRARGQHQAAAFRGEGFGGSEADPAAGTGNQRDFVLQLQVHRTAPQWLHRKGFDHVAYRASLSPTRRPREARWAISASERTTAACTRRACTSPPTVLPYPSWRRLSRGFFGSPGHAGPACPCEQICAAAPSRVS